MTVVEDDRAVPPTAGAPRAGVPAPRRRTPFTLRGFFERHLWAWVLLIPSLVIVGVVVLYPVVSGILLSFQEFKLTRPGGNGWVGLDQYVRFFTDPSAQRALFNTVVYVAVGVTSQLLLGLGTALLLNRTYRGVWLVRLIVMLPWFLPTVVSAHMWALMLDARLGVINDILVKVGLLDTYRAWFSDPATALLTVLAVELWRAYPLFTLFILARLQSIPPELLEAGSVDGASVWQRFRYIILPLLRPIIVVAVVLESIRLANVPDMLLVLTGGGPGDATQVLSLYAYTQAYSSYDFGYSAAISVVLMLALLVFTVIYIRVSRVRND